MTVGREATTAAKGYSDRRWLLLGALGIAGYVLLAVLPVVVMLLPPRPEGRTFLRELSVALAFSGLSVMGLQLLLTARFRRVKAPYGIDAVIHFHRQVSLVALGLVAVHPVLLVLDDPETLQLLHVFSAPWRARFAIAALVSTALVVGLSYLRRRVGLGYELWRRTHGLLAVVALVASVAHIELVGNYVNTPFKRELWIVYPAVWIAVLGWTRVVRPATLLSRPWNVSEVRPERGSAWTLRLKPAAKSMDFDPGQFVWLHLGHSPFAMAEHPFSISSAPSDGEHIELTVKALGDFTSTIGDTVPGSTAYVDGPYGQFSIDRHSAERYVFIAGGVGITPFMSMLREMSSRGDDRPVTLVYGVSSLEEMTFAEDIESLAASDSLDFVPVPARAEEGWTGETGLLDAGMLARHLPDDLDGVEFFVCGPEPMLRAVSSALGELGVHPSQIRYELFGLV